MNESKGERVMDDTCENGCDTRIRQHSFDFVMSPFDDLIDWNSGYDCIPFSPDGSLAGSSTALSSVKVVKTENNEEKMDDKMDDKQSLSLMKRKRPFLNRRYKGRRK
jgi:hypothetical protein